MLMTHMTFTIVMLQGLGHRDYLRPLTTKHCTGKIIWDGNRKLQAKSCNGIITIMRQYKYFTQKASFIAIKTPTVISNNN